jgi:hypothetical protein
MGSQRVYVGGHDIDEATDSGTMDGVTGRQKKLVGIEKGFIKKF